VAPKRKKSKARGKIIVRVSPVVSLATRTAHQAARASEKVRKAIAQERKAMAKEGRPVTKTQKARRKKQQARLKLQGKTLSQLTTAENRLKRAARSLSTPLGICCPQSMGFPPLP
jgi:hypothetical protein